MKVKCSLKAAKNVIVEEAIDMWTGIRNQRCTLGFVFAIICVFMVIVGNVILLIGLNFWLTVFPQDNLARNSSQIAIQVVASLLMVLFFSAVMGVFVAVFGGVPVWRALTDTNRMGNPSYRFFLLFASGASNGLSGVTAVYSMSHTPEFLQAVLLCCIPFSAQAWTVIFIPEERKRNYLSLFFIGSAMMLVAGILLSSMAAFLADSAHAGKASWEWALIYLLSSIMFGLWCVVQRLYLDAMIVREGCERDGAVEDDDEEGANDTKGKKAAKSQKYRSGDSVENDNELPSRSSSAAAHNDNDASGDVGVVVLTGDRNGRAREQRQDTDSMIGAGATEPCSARSVRSPLGKRKGGTSSKSGHGAVGIVKLDDGADTHPSVNGNDADDADADDYDDELDDGASSHAALLLAEKRSWAKQSVNDNAAKLVLLLGGLFFQLLVSFVVFPVDAIPWFGTSSSVSEAWEGFANSVNFIFRSWFNIRYGLLYTLGYIMSFIGCTFLNEHSPTLASVVLQLAGPITSLVIIIIPQWNVYKDSGNVGHKVGGVVLLISAAFLYHIWEQRSLREMVQRAHRRKEEQLQHEPAEQRIIDSVEHADVAVNVEPVATDGEEHVGGKHTVALGLRDPHGKQARFSPP